MQKLKSHDREIWMHRVVDYMRPWFKDQGHPLPPIRISTGFTSGGRRGSAAAECWTDKADPQNHYQIFIDPRDDDVIFVINSVLHEAIHAAVGIDQGHKGDFATLALALGMQRPLDKSPSGPEFEKLARKIVRAVGKYPHRALQIGHGPTQEAILGPLVNGMAPAAGGGGKRPSTVVTSGPKPQRARLLKVACTDCGYTARITAKWIHVAVPGCPNPGCQNHGTQMEVG